MQHVIERTNSEAGQKIVDFSACRFRKLKVWFLKT
jgi:hypothetical protein